jgi:glutaredoxin 3
MARVFMYTTSYCPYCARAKALLRSKGVGWEEVDVEREPARREEMRQRSGRATVPQIWIDDRHVGGCNDLMALDARGELDSLLAK